jgi:hypothetical protein
MCIYIYIYIYIYIFLIDSNASSRSDHSEYERDVLGILHECLPSLPITSADLIDQLRKNLNADVSSTDIHKILEKLAAQDIVKLVNLHYVHYHMLLFIITLYYFVYNCL